MENLEISNIDKTLLLKVNENNQKRAQDLIL